MRWTCSTRAARSSAWTRQFLQNMGIDKKDANSTGGVPNKLKLDEVDSLLRQGAYDVFSEDDSATDASTSEKTSAILWREEPLSLERELRTLVHQRCPRRLLSLRKGKQTNVDVNDPDLFGKKLMPDASAAPEPNI